MNLVLFLPCHPSRDMMFAILCIPRPPLGTHFLAVFSSPSALVGTHVLWVLCTKALIAFLASLFVTWIILLSLVSLLIPRSLLCWVFVCHIALLVESEYSILNTSNQ